MASKKPEPQDVVVPKTAADVQRLKLEKLMKNPDKPVNVPGKLDDKTPRVFNPPEFIRNIWGSSAGAGSGDFHVYRGIRRREYARQKFLNEKTKLDAADVEYRDKVEANKKEADERTAKKRKKRLKKKEKQKQKKAKKTKEDSKGKMESESEEEDEDEDDDAADA